VHPVDILSETLELDAVGGLDGLLSRLPQKYRDALLSKPYWLQDDTDGRCLGPTGFSECGDATLWLVKRRPIADQSDDKADSKKKRGFFSLLSPGQIYESHRKLDERDWGYALELVSMDSTHKDDGECLLARGKKRQRKNEKSIILDKRPLRLGKCAESNSWDWRFDGEGVLSKALPAKKDKVRTHSFNDTAICVWREHNSTTAFTAPCQSQHHNDGEERIVEFSLVRYQASPTVHGDPLLMEDTLPVSDNLLQTPQKNVPAVETRESSVTSYDSNESSQQLALSDSSSQGTHTLPHTKTLSEVHAHRPALHHDLNPMSSMLKLSVSLKPPKNPQQAKVFTSGKSKTTTTTPGKLASQLHAQKRTIPVHPYIAASKDQIWVDPQTGLEFPTDLCEYLGHTKKESGRHTLMGVGQYLKTVFNVKVYGVALYVSKRDVLADHTFKKFATLTTSQLQESREFYEYLMSTPTSDSGRVDRTLLVKINMQLGTDTMRSSMEADWKMLTQEDKDALISSSFKARDASTNMLKTIKNEDNPSRCSCGQIAPEEYEADPTCCARGTEMVFTWRKNGDLEVRLDGDLMDTFPRPSLASGMFYEYLRFDDPISPDARVHFADGFPFLLAPLAHVIGISMPPSADQHQESPQHKQSKVLMHRFVEDAFGAVAEHATGFASYVTSQMDQAVSSVGQAPKLAEQSIRGTGSFLNKRRKEAAHHLTSFSAHSMEFLARRLFFLPDEWRKQTLLNSVSISLNGKEWDVVHKILPNRSNCDPNQSDRCELPHRNDETDEDYSRGPSIPFFDEIGVIITPALDFTHQLYLYMVHLYLMLLLIVSFPEHTTKTRLVVTRRRRETYSDGNSTCSGSVEKWDVSLSLSYRRKSKSGKAGKDSARHNEKKAMNMHNSTFDAEPSKSSSCEELQHNSNIKKSLSYFL